MLFFFFVFSLLFLDRLPPPNRDPRDPRGGPPPPSVPATSSGPPPSSHQEPARGVSTFPDRRDSGSGQPSPGKNLNRIFYLYLIIHYIILFHSQVFGFR